MNYKNLYLAILACCFHFYGNLQAQSFDDMFSSKIEHLQQISSLEVIQYYNTAEKNLLVQAIDDGRNWLEPKISEKMQKVQVHSLISENQILNLSMKHEEYVDLKNQLEEYIAESPAFAFGTGYTKSQWSRISRSAKKLLENEKALYLHLYNIQKTLDKKAAEIAAAKRKINETNSEKSEHASIDNSLINSTKDRETDIYKYSTFGLLFGIGLWMFVKFRDNV